MRSVSGRLHLSTLLSLFVHFLLCYSESNEASPGSQCCQNPPTLDPSSGSGHVEQLGGLSCYIAAASPHSKLAIILVSDVYGYEAPNLRKLADKVAAAGFYAVAPDYFYGDPFVREKTERPVPVWIKDHSTDKGFEDTRPVIEALKSKGVSAIGAAGFCWGGKVVVELAKSSYVQAAVLLHPSYVSVDDIKGVKVPIAVLGAEMDKAASPALLKQFEEILTAKPEVDSFLKIYPGVGHGWTVRYDPKDAVSVKRAEEAYQDMLGWFSKHVK